MLSKLFGKKKLSERFPEDNLTFGQGERDGLPALAMINLAYRGYAFCRDYPWHLEIKIAMKDTPNSGLPSNDEAEVLNELEDLVEKQMKRAGVAHFIARQTWNGTRMIDYYVEDGPAVETILSDLHHQGTVARPFQFKIERDDTWSSCAGFFQHF